MGTNSFEGEKGWKHNLIRFTFLYKCLFVETPAILFNEEKKTSLISIFGIISYTFLDNYILQKISDIFPSFLPYYCVYV